MDPKLSGSLERIITIYLTYLITKYGAGIPGLSGIIPDLIVVGGSGLSLAYGLWANRKAGLISNAATAVPNAKIILDPKDPASHALADVTPNNVTVGAFHV